MMIERPWSYGSYRTNSVISTHRILRQPWTKIAAIYVFYMCVGLAWKVLIPAPLSSPLLGCRCHTLPYCRPLSTLPYYCHFLSLLSSESSKCKAVVHFQHKFPSGSVSLECSADNLHPPLRPPLKTLSNPVIVSEKTPSRWGINKRCLGDIFIFGHKQQRFSTFSNYKHKLVNTSF